MAWYSVFKRFWGVADKGLELAKKAGLNDRWVEIAIPMVKAAATIYLTSTERRAVVLRKLMELGVPESVGRISIELAYQVVKSEGGLTEGGLLPPLTPLGSPPPTPPVAPPQ